MTNILLVVNNLKFRKRVTKVLTRGGYNVSEVENSHQAISEFQQIKSFDLVLIDMALPGLSGVDLCAWIRARSDVPIIVLSALANEDLKVAALETGADEYVSKPFGNRELLASVRALLRRTYAIGNYAETKVRIGELIIDLESRRIFIGKQEVDLTRTEYELIAALAEHLDGIVTHEELLNRVWGPEYRSTKNYLHNYFSRLRRKLGEYSQLIENVPGMGYILHSKATENQR
jgi:two-component system, OmpR family, KDP operon response regulator KdpE